MTGFPDGLAAVASAGPASYRHLSGEVLTVSLNQDFDFKYKNTDVSAHLRLTAFGGGCFESLYLGIYSQNRGRNDE